MVDRVRNLPIGAHFILKRTGDRYELLGHKRDTPGGTHYVVQRLGFTKPGTLHPACHVRAINTQSEHTRTRGRRP